MRHLLHLYKTYKTVWMLYCSDAKDFYVKKILRINTMALLITLAYNKSFSTASSV